MSEISEVPLTTSHVGGSARKSSAETISDTIDQDTINDGHQIRVWFSIIGLTILSSFFFTQEIWWVFPAAIFYGIIWPRLALYLYTKKIIPSLQAMFVIDTLWNGWWIALMSFYPLTSLPFFIGPLFMAIYQVGWTRGFFATAGILLTGAILTVLIRYALNVPLDKIINFSIPISTTTSALSVASLMLEAILMASLAYRNKAALDVSNKNLELANNELEVANSELAVANRELAITNRELVEASNDAESRRLEMENIATKISKYLPYQIYHSVFHEQREVRLENQRKKLTVFFSDIERFSSISERMEAEQLTSLLNDYLTQMSDIAMHHGGLVDKFIGDGIVIFFGDPESKGEKGDALACVKMALAMRERVKTLRFQWDALGVPAPLRIRIGINTGYCTVGNFGSARHMDYTVIGGPVILAKRLEELSPADEILISHDTYTLIKDEVFCQKGDEILVKGISYPVQTYRVIGLLQTFEGDDKLKRSEKELEEKLETILSLAAAERDAASAKSHVLALLESSITKIQDDKRDF